MKLYDFKAAPNARRVSMFIAEKGLDIPRVEVNLQAQEQLSEPLYLVVTLGALLCHALADDRGPGGASPAGASRLGLLAALLAGLAALVRSLGLTLALACAWEVWRRGGPQRNARLALVALPSAVW